MANLRKGERCDITKDTGVQVVTCAMGWDVNAYDPNETFDLDVLVFLTGASGKVASEEDFIYFNHRNHVSGAVQLSKDNRTGEGSGDDESAVIDLTKVPESVEKIVFAAAIFDAEKKMQNFGMVNNAYIKVVGTDSKEELCRYEMDEDFSLETGLIAGELYRRNGEWKFNPVGQGIMGGLEAICEKFGVSTREE